MLSRSVVFLGTFGVLLALQSGCLVPVAPMVRTEPLGAPGTVGKDQVGVQGAAVLWPGTGVGGGGAVVLPLGKDWHVEVGGSGGPWWAMGSAGLRKTFRRKDFDGHGWVADIGAGGGLGGADSLMGLAGDSVEDMWIAVAGGGYLDAGVGFRIKRIVTPFLRARGQVSATQVAPTTLWWDVGAGLEFYPSADHFAVFISGSATGFTNGLAVGFSGGANVGITVMFDIKRKKDP